MVRLCAIRPPPVRAGRHIAVIAQLYGACERLNSCQSHWRKEYAVDIKNGSDLKVSNCIRAPTPKVYKLWSPCWPTLNLWGILFFFNWEFYVHTLASVATMKIFNSLKILYLALPSLVFAQTNINNIQNEPISAFVTSAGSGSSDYVFALNIPSNSEDIYFHLSGPAAYSWIAVGTGSRMKNSLMFLAYLNATGNGALCLFSLFLPRMSRDAWSRLRFEKKNQLTFSLLQVWRSVHVSAPAKTSRATRRLWTWKLCQARRW